MVDLHPPIIPFSRNHSIVVVTGMSMTVIARAIHPVSLSSNTVPPCPLHATPYLTLSSRNQPPAIKAGSPLSGHGAGQEVHARASTATSDKASGDSKMGAAPSARGKSTSARFQKHNRTIADANTPSIAKETQQNTAGPAASTAPRGSAVGGMVLDAPDVMLSVREREVQAPAPIKIVVGRGGAVNTSRGQGRGRRGGISEGTDVLGGFPAVRHRSEMGGLKLGDLRAVAAAAAEAPAVSEAAFQARRFVLRPTSRTLNEMLYTQTCLGMRNAHNLLLRLCSHSNRSRSNRHSLRSNRHSLSTRSIR